MTGATEEDTDRMEVSEQFGQCAMLILAFMLMSSAVYTSHAAAQAEAYKEELTEWINKTPNGVGKEANAARSDVQLLRLLSVWERQFHRFDWHVGIVRFGDVSFVQLGSAPEFFPDDERFTALDTKVREVFADDVQTTVVKDFIRDVVAEAKLDLDEFDLQALHSDLLPRLAGQEQQTEEQETEPVAGNRVTDRNLKRLASQIRDDLTKDRQELFQQQKALGHRIFQQRIQHELLTGLSTTDSDPNVPTEGVVAFSETTEAIPNEELHKILQKLSECFFVLPETRVEVRGE